MWRNSPSNGSPKNKVWCTSGSQLWMFGIPGKSKKSRLEERNGIGVTKVFVQLHLTVKNAHLKIQKDVPTAWNDPEMIPSSPRKSLLKNNSRIPQNSGRLSTSVDICRHLSTLGSRTISSRDFFCDALGSLHLKSKSLVNLCGSFPEQGWQGTPLGCLGNILRELDSEEISLNDTKWLEITINLLRRFGWNNSCGPKARTCKVQDFRMVKTVAWPHRIFVCFSSC